MRVDRGLSIQELADKAEMSYQSLWRIERGQQGDPGLFTAGRLARALQCSLDYLVDLYSNTNEGVKLSPAAVA
jgi:transcriptional regulator with XRE-family HTH domain